MQLRLTPQETPTKPHTAARVLFASGMPSQPAATDGSTLPLAQDTQLLVAEQRAHRRAITYRGTVATLRNAVDVSALAWGDVMLVVWLLVYLLLGRASAPQAAIGLRVLLGSCCSFLSLSSVLQLLDVEPSQ